MARYKHFVEIHLSLNVFWTLSVAQGRSPQNMRVAISHHPGIAKFRHWKNVFDTRSSLDRSGSLGSAGPFFGDKIGFKMSQASHQAGTLNLGCGLQEKSPKHQTKIRICPKIRRSSTPEDRWGRDPLSASLARTCPPDYARHCQI